MLPDDTKPLRRTLLLSGGFILTVFVTIFEPRSTADMVAVSAGVAMVISGLYLTRRAEDEAMERVERERELLVGEPDTAPEDGELPRRGASDGEG